MTNDSALPGGAEMKGVLSTRPSRISPGPPRRWIHFHAESDIATKASMPIRKLQAHRAPFENGSLFAPSTALQKLTVSVLSGSFDVTARPSVAAQNELAITA